MNRQTLPQQQLFHHLALAAALALSAVACAKDVPTGAQPCPCADGYVCCQSGVCAQGQDACDEATSALSARAVGRWTGYIENYTGLASGADSLTLSFSLADDGTLQGTAKLGDATAPAPATDPNAPWPPGITEKTATNGPGIVEGFVYPAHAIKWEARRLRFEISFPDPWKPWCELQTSYDVGSQSGATGMDAGTSTVPDWRCVPYGSYGHSDATTCQIFGDAGPIATLPCAKIELCEHPRFPCVCTPTGCTSTPSMDAESADFDIALAGDSGDGSVQMGDMYNVRLVRASH